ncbi:MAG TPA: amidohydrolase family protein [Candidatus Polarisedimenticolaceae bacterium]|nr:amidohydrolase family protein [Candidatus Polarisedimenticolaceae bacterium]
MLCLVVLTVAASGAVAAERLAVRAARVHPVSAAVIEDGVVLIEDGKIAAVGPASRVRVPDGVEVIEAETVTPGLIDVHTVVGLAGIYNSDRGQVQDQDQLEKSDPVQPQLRAIDAYDAVEPLVAWVRSLGVTTVHTGHGPGAVVSGQTLIAKTRGATVEEAVIVPAAAVAATLTEEVSRNFDSPGTHAKTTAALREALVTAAAYREARQADKPVDRDLAKETMARVLDGELALMVTAQTATEIATALRLRREFGFTLWLDGAAEAYRMIDPIREAGVPVLLHPTMMRAGRETRNAAFDTAVKLAEAGIPFAIQSGFEDYVPKTRVLLYEAQVAVSHGLDPDQALAAITLAPAEILGLDRRLGSIEVGKDADLVLFDGDPFEYTSHVCRVIIDGLTVAEECR